MIPRMEPQLKERLIGAAVLVALGVWLIPWVLDGPTSETASESASASLELPSPEEAPAIRTERIDLNARRDTRPAEVGAVEPSPRDATATADASTEREVEPTVEPVAEPEPAASEPAEPEPVIAAAETDDEPKPEAGPAEPSGDWAVQLGSFGERENAERLATRVAAVGTEPDVSTTRAAGRTMYRVRVGPHASRELAEAAAASLSAHGFVAQVVTVD